ncbi:cinnamoyl-CoA reductase 1-like isoform X2 [Triticum urartu]|uniref:cinnamoyl-CoA reductase 1-like isoform X2 n=1 Tax=Triticum urartu TaxID=4572 RepID=UPI0020431759|nr:cinnamoyl-CoA reductase 1-like isoform X2 [Triticum urartu]
MAPPRVCVTGGGGYIASWLVKLLLSRGYAVHATVRDPCDQKNAHLMQLDGAAESLSLFKADVLDRAALAAAVEGCQGVFHVASPVPADKTVDPESEIMVPAVKGTLNILEVCSSLKVQKVVVVSSTAAVHSNPNWPQGKPKDESCWSDRKICMEKEAWYSLAKTVAEEAAWEYAEKNELNVVTLCPCIVFGPQLQPVVNTTSELLIYVIKESSGRYICAPNYISTKALLELLKKTYPDYNYVKCKADAHQNSPVTPISSAKLSNLGWNPRALEETLLDSIEYYRKMGILQDVEGQTYRLPYIFRHYQAAEE